MMLPYVSKQNTALMRISLHDGVQGVKVMQEFNKGILMLGRWVEEEEWEEGEVRVVHFLQGICPLISFRSRFHGRQMSRYRGRNTSLPCQEALKTTNLLAALGRIKEEGVSARTRQRGGSAD